MVQSGKGRKVDLVLSCLALPRLLKRWSFRAASVIRVRCTRGNKERIHQIRSCQISRMNQATAPAKSMASTSPSPNQKREDIACEAAGLSVKSMSPSTR